MPAVPFRQQRNLEVSEGLQPGTSVQVVVRGVESLAGIAFFLWLEVGQQLRRSRRLGKHGTLRRIVGDEGAEHAVVAHQVPAGGSVKLLGLDPVQLITGVEEESPVAERDELGKRHREGLRVSQCALIGRARLLECATEFGGRRPLARKAALDDLDHPVANRLQRCALVDHGAKDNEARLARIDRVRENL